MPTVSVIVPVYKVEPWLRRCVDSVLTQTFADFELVLVDDGSPDNCGAICDEYAEKDSRVHVIHQKNGGLSAARNAGIDAAQGEYLSFIDSDDLVRPQMLERMLQAIETSDADLCICHLQSFSQETELENLSTPQSSPVILDNRSACLRLYEDQGGIYTVACAKLYQRELFRDLRFPVGMLHEDEATTYQALYHARAVVVLPEAYYYYRQNPNSIMGSKFSVRRFDALKALHERREFFLTRQEEALTRSTEIAIQTTKAVLNIMAKNAGIHSDVPSEYRISISTALRILRRYASEKKYLYCLNMVRPWQIRPHEYWRKIKQLLHIPCN